jgi:hypothetical protein
MSGISKIICIMDTIIVGKIYRTAPMRAMDHPHPQDIEYGVYSTEFLVWSVENVVYYT